MTKKERKEKMEELLIRLTDYNEEERKLIIAEAMKYDRNN